METQMTDKGVVSVIIEEIIRNGTITRVEKALLTRILDVYLVDSQFVQEKFFKMVKMRASWKVDPLVKGCPAIVYSRVYTNLVEMGFLNPEDGEEDGLMKLGYVFRVPEDIADEVRRRIRRADRLASDYGRVEDIDKSFCELEPKGACKELYKGLLEKPEDFSDLLVVKKTPAPASDTWRFTPGVDGNEKTGGLEELSRFFKTHLPPFITIPLEKFILGDKKNPSSERIIDALKIGKGPVLELYRPTGELVWSGDVKRELVGMAIMVAQKSLWEHRNKGYKIIEELCDALLVAENWLRGQSDLDTLERVAEVAKSLRSLTFTEHARSVFYALEAARNATIGACAVVNATYGGLKAAACIKGRKDYSEESLANKCSFEAFEASDSGQNAFFEKCNIWITKIILDRIQRKVDFVDIPLEPIEE